MKRPKIPIEDAVEDVIGKAMRGLGLDPSSLAAAAALPTERIEALLEGHSDSEAIQAVASPLELSSECLLAQVGEAWYPDEVFPDWVARFNTPYPVAGYAEMTVNSYLFWSDAEAVAVDTGADIKPLLSEVQRRGLRLGSLLITHTHADHIAALETLRRACPAMVVCSPVGDPVEGATLLREGDLRQCGRLTIEAIETSGHSAGALSYLVKGDAQCATFVGDAIFCLSIGKAPNAYRQALRHVREKILALPLETTLFPGHGPMTTVRQELLRNPFFNG